MRLALPVLVFCVVYALAQDCSTQPYQQGGSYSVVSSGSAACLQFDCSPQDPVCDASGDGSYRLFFTRPSTPGVVQLQVALNSTGHVASFSIIRESAVLGDGILVHPVNRSYLVTAYQDTVTVLRIDNGVVLQTLNVGNLGAQAYHLKFLPGTDKIIGTPIVGLNFANRKAVVLRAEPDGRVTFLNLITNSEASISSMVTTPGGVTFATDGGFTGHGNVRRVTFDNPASPTAVASNVACGGGVDPAAHGTFYDPFSNTLVVTGANHVSQYDVTTCAKVSTRNFVIPGISFQLDQGTTDGRGGYYLANNNGGIIFLQLNTASNPQRLVQFASIQQILNVGATDDIAPLLGEAGSCN